MFLPRGFWIWFFWFVSLYYIALFCLYNSIDVQLRCGNWVAILDILKSTISAFLLRPLVIIYLYFYPELRPIGVPVRFDEIKGIPVPSKPSPAECRQRWYRFPGRSHKRLAWYPYHRTSRFPQCSTMYRRHRFPLRCSCTWFQRLMYLIPSQIRAILRTIPIRLPMMWWTWTWIWSCTF